MADSVKATASLDYIFTLKRGDSADVLRTISVPTASLRNNPQAATVMESIKAAGASMETFILGSGSTLIQPSTWRDTDEAELEYVTTGLQLRHSETYDILLDLHEEEG